MKKLICLIVCFVLLVHIVPQDAMAAGTFDARLSHDIISLFENTGVLEKNDPFVSNKDALVSRGEFARLLVRILGCSDIVASHTDYEEIYKDVKQNTQYYQEIIFATKLGLFGDKITSYFYPKDNATVQWAAECLARALGYSQHIKVNLSAVYSLDILDGVISDNGFLRRDGALKMLCNALDVPVVEAVGISGDDIVLSSLDDRNFLDVYFDIYFAEDVLLGDYFTSISGEKPDREYVHFSSGIFKAAGLETKNLVGLNLRYYYRQNGTEKEVLHFEKLENIQLVVTAENAAYSYSDNSYTVNIDGKDKVASLELGTLVSYNGKPHFDKNKMLPASGQVTLIDNDEDGKYEVCIVREYKNIIVDAVNVSGEKIYDSIDSTRNINAGDFERFTVYNAKGEELNLSQIEKDSVLTIYVSADSKDAECYVSEKSAALKLEETNITEGTLTIDKNTYGISPDFRMLVSALKPGQSYLFYLNHLGEVVYASVNWEHETLYIMETGTDGVLETGLWIKGLNANGDISEYALADRLNWVTHESGINNISKEDAYARLNSNGGQVNRQLVKFATDLNGRIREIVIAHEITNRAMIDTVNPDYPLVRMSYYSDPSQWPQDFLTYVTSTSKHRVSYSGGIFGHFMPLSTSATELVVPLNTTLSYNESDVHAWTWGALQTTPTVYVENLDVYGSGDDCISVDYLVSAIGTRTSKTDAGYNMQPYLVLEVSNVLDSSEGEVTKLKLSNRNGVVSNYYLADEDIISCQSLENEARAEGATSAVIPADKTAIEAGDIVSLQLDSRGKIERLRLIYDGKGQRDIHPSATTVLNTTGDIVTGKILRKSGTVFEIEAMAGSDIAEGTSLVYKFTNGIVEYDARLGTVRTLTSDELYIGDIIHIYMRYGSYRMIVVYKNI